MLLGIAIFCCIIFLVLSFRSREQTSPYILTEDAHQEMMIRIEESIQESIIETQFEDEDQNTTEDDAESDDGSPLSDEA